MRRKVFMILLALNVAFIWGNSTLDGTDSKGLSDRVIAVLVEIFDIDYTGDREDEPDMNFLVRKAAHATEFALLGVLSAALLSGKGQKERGWRCVAVLFGVLVALMDETIQLFHGRTSSVKDVWLDCAGLLAGILLVVLYRKWKDRKRRGAWD